LCLRFFLLMCCHSTLLHLLFFVSRSSFRYDTATTAIYTLSLHDALPISALDGTNEISLAHLEPAAALVRYSIDSARALFVDTSTPAKLLAWITEAGDQGRTRKDITRDYFKGKAKAEQIGGMLDQLIDAARLTRHTRARADGKPGREIGRAHV